MHNKYREFLTKKSVTAPHRGMTTIPLLAKHLFPFQRHCTEFALRVGAAGIFLDTGLGKTEIQLEFCQRAIEACNKPAIILTPLAVAGQTARRAEKWGYDARIIRDAADAGRGINILNYDRLGKIDPSDFSIVSLDEASILKSFTGKTRVALANAFHGYRFRLVATATPAPNDHMEIGSYADFLEIMSSNEMLSRFFINDTSTASQAWRLKAHAVRPFWDWMASWARMAELPSDITQNSDDDAGYKLPPFRIIRHRATDSKISDDLADLFGAISMSATNLHDVKRKTSAARAEKAAEIVAAEPGEPWLLWCDTDYESAAIKAAIPDAIEIKGSQTSEEKEEKIEAFETGKARIIIGKPSMLGFGLDWSHCARMAFVGRSYSYETWYQAVRRCWRYGQGRTVDVHIIVAEGEAEIGRVIDRKESDHASMKLAMRDAMARSTANRVETKVAYNPQHLTELPTWLSNA